MSVKLFIIGYWHSVFEPDFPDPAEFVDVNWNKSKKDKLLTHLTSGQQMPYYQMGDSWCRFRCGNENLGSLEFIDGKYVWPEGLPHYIEIHNIRLPQLIIDDFSYDNKQKVDFNGCTIEFDYERWKGQKGWNNSAKSYRHILDIGILTILQKNSLYYEKQKTLLISFLQASYGIKSRLDIVEKTLKGELLEICGRFKNYESFALEANRIGLETSFTEMSIDEMEDII